MEENDNLFSIFSEDYRYLSDSFWKNEQVGESRINIFIGIVTLVVGALVTLATSDNGPRPELVNMVIIWSLLPVSVLGTITLLRMQIRNEAADRYKRGMDTIRQAMKDHLDKEGDLAEYYPIGLPEVKKSWHKDSVEESKMDRKSTKAEEKSSVQIGRQFKLRKFGGLAHTMSAINAMLVAAIVAATIYPSSAPFYDSGGFESEMTYAAATATIAVLVFVFAFVVQVVYIGFREAGARKKLNRGRPTHAFGVVYTKQGDDIKYLVIRPKNWRPGKPDEWVLPKGHIEPGEGHGEAAIREVREETGYSVFHPRLIVGNVVFTAAGEWVNGKAYLLEFINVSSVSTQSACPDNGENREVEWKSYDDAFCALTYPESRLILKIGEAKQIY